MNICSVRGNYTICEMKSLVSNEISFSSIKFLVHMNIKSCEFLNIYKTYKRPPLWSSGQSFWLQIQRSRVRFPALPDFLNGNGSGTGYTQPREVN